MSSSSSGKNITGKAKSQLRRKNSGRKNSKSDKDKLETTTTSTESQDIDEISKVAPGKQKKARADKGEQDVLEATTAPTEPQARIDGSFKSALEKLEKSPSPDLKELLASLNGKISIIPTPDNDTRYDRRNNTIYIYNKKEGNEEIAAIAFELNNAANPHTFTNAVEEKLLKMSQAGIDPTGLDFIHVAKEMERDEFISLQNYYQQAQQMYPPPKKVPTIIAEKYEQLLDDNQELSYPKFVEQNRTTGHTIELAEAQYQAYYGLPTFEDELADTIPVQYLQPLKYQLNQQGVYEGVGTGRTKQPNQERLDSQKQIEVNPILLSETE